MTVARTGMQTNEMAVYTNTLLSAAYNTANQIQIKKIQYRCKFLVFLVFLF